MKTHENIKAFREKCGFSQEELAIKVGYKDRSSIAKIEAGLVDLSQSKIAAFAAALHVTPAQLMGIVDTNRSLPDNILPLPPTKRWKILGATACGEAIHHEYDDEFVTAPEDIDADYVFRCKGDSMIGAHIFDGDLVFIKEGEEVMDGQIGVVRVGDEYMLKRLYHGADYLELRSENPAYPPKVIRGEQENAQIVGKAVKILTRAI